MRIRFATAPGVDGRFFTASKAAERFDFVIRTVELALDPHRYWLLPVSPCALPGCRGLRGACT